MIENAGVQERSDIMTIKKLREKITELATENVRLQAMIDAHDCQWGGTMYSISAAQKNAPREQGQET